MGKKKVRFLVPLALFALLIAACSKAPLRIPLKDFDVKVKATTPTGGKVIYPKTAAKFDKPVLNVKTISLAGEVTPEATAKSGSMTITFYARVDDPKDAGCKDLEVIWVCDKEKEKPISERTTLTYGQANPIQLGHPNADILADGLNQGSIWIGAEIESGLSADTTLHFRKMIASVTVF